jgi:hypothetical protein
MAFGDLDWKVHSLRAVIGAVSDRNRKHQLAFDELKDEILAIARLTSDKELEDWVRAEMKDNENSQANVAAALKEAEDEAQTETEDNDEERQRHLKHLVDLQQNLLAQISIRETYLLDAIDRMRAKLGRPPIKKTLAN